MKRLLLLLGTVVLMAAGSAHAQYVTIPLHDETCVGLGAGVAEYAHWNNFGTGGNCQYAATKIDNQCLGPGGNYAGHQVCKVGACCCDKYWEPAPTVTLHGTAQSCSGSPTGAIWVLYADSCDW